jgi:DNA-binding transcriptional LysR family regulator
MLIETEFDLAGLRIFQVVATTGSMSSASRELGLTQSAISQRIQTMEQRVGVQLFDRNMRPLALTPAGQVLSQRAQQLLLDAGQITAAVRLAARQPTITFRIGLPESLAPLFAPPLAIEAARLAATSVIRTRTRLPSVEAFLAREIDILITPDPMIDSDGVEHFPLLTKEHYVLLAPKKKKKRLAAKTVRDLIASGLPFLGYISPTFTARHIKNHLRRLGFQPDRAQQVDVMGVLIDLVGRGAGWTIASPIAFAASGAPNHVEVYPLVPTLERSLSIVARRNEFGAVPRELAGVCRATIQSRIAPVVAERMPWLPKIY